MTCYQRHMTWLFEELGLEYDKANRRDVDTALRELLAVPAEAHCPEIWAAVKGLEPDELTALAPGVAARLRG